MAMLEFNKGIIAEFRENDGEVGGDFAGLPLVLVTMKGAKTGRTLCSPLVYTDQDGDRIIIASKAGAPDNPDWYHNLRANPDVSLEVGTGEGVDKYEATAVLVGEDERQALYDRHAAEQPQFLEYARLAAETDRKIPVFRLVRKA